MENYVFDNEEEAKGELTEVGESEIEDGFMEGYAEEEELQECAECGVAITEEKKRIVKEIEGETYVFCCKQCAQEFEESLN